jgi:hypothetical protein
MSGDRPRINSSLRAQEGATTVCEQSSSSISSSSLGVRTPLRLELPTIDTSVPVG